MNIRPKLFGLALIILIPFLLFHCKKEEDVKIVDFTQLAKYCSSTGNGSLTTELPPDSKVVLIDGNESYIWNDYLPKSMVPLETSEVDFVGCLVFGYGESLEICKYVRTDVLGKDHIHTLERRKQKVRIDLINTKTKTVVASKIFFGSEPQRCPPFKNFSGALHLYANGPKVSYTKEIENFLLTGK